MSGLYAADGSINVTVVDGSTYTGLYASDGSWNVIKSSGSTYVGAYHPCGALWVSITNSLGSSIRCPDGSLFVYTGSYTGNGQRVTVVSGSLSPGSSGAFIPLFF